MLERGKHLQGEGSVEIRHPGGTNLHSRVRCRVLAKGCQCLEVEGLYVGWDERALADRTDMLIERDGVCGELLQAKRADSTRAVNTVTASPAEAF